MMEGLRDVMVTEGEGVPSDFVNPKVTLTFTRYKFYLYKRAAARRMLDLYSQRSHQKLQIDVL